MGTAILVGGAAGAFLLRKRKLIGAVMGIAVGLGADELWARYRQRQRVVSP
ncbi:MAG TPA: hypothetical protein VIY27_02080 [Myxococcota bacterium]